MAKAKYHFDTKSLSIRKHKVTWRDRILKMLWFLASGMVFSAAIMLVAYSFFDSPKEIILKREVEQYKLQYSFVKKKLNQVDKIVADLQQRDDNIYRVIFEADPIPSEVRQAGIGGANRYAELEGYRNSEILTETAKKLDNITRSLYVQSKSFDEVFRLAKNKSQMMASIPGITPISSAKGRLVSGFGYRIHPIYKKLKMHTGIDFAAPKGTPIYATGDGKVVRLKGFRAGYGIVCIISHGYGYHTVYAHMSKKIVKSGQKVKRGEIIGYVGSTGLSVAPHLHYEIVKNGKKVNPVHYFYNDLTPEEYEEMIEIASRVTQSLS